MLVCPFTPLCPFLVTLGETVAKCLCGWFRTVEGNCSWTLRRKPVHYRVTPKGHLGKAINLKINVSTGIEEQGDKT